MSFKAANIEITKAESVNAGTTEPNPWGPGHSAPLPAYCRVEGVVNRRTGVDGEEFGIGFVLAIPEKWNSDFLMQGGAGSNGVILPPLGLNAAGDTPGLMRGFAVVSTDTGHKSHHPGFDFGFMKDQQAYLDFAYMANAEVATLSKQLVAQYYGKAPSFSYFSGCSTGGREGMILSQRYPTVFDGIISGDPAMRTGLSNLAIGKWIPVAFNQVAPKDSDGKPIITQAITECRVAAQAAAATLAQLRQLAACSDDQQLEAVLTAAELKSTKQEEYERIGQSLIERNAVPDLKQIEDEAAGFELDKLHSQIDSREERQRVLEDVELFEAAKEYGRLCQEYERLQGSEESILHAQKAEDALAKVRPAVAQYLRLRLASEVLERAIGSYREKHQGPVLQRASELFSRLTLGDHVGLTTAFGEGDKPVLMAVRQSMEQVEVGGLSDGTRDQMYLALRLAAIEHHIESVAPCPVIFDDILINSDDSRAAAALEIISEVARHTQVLFFTHHIRLAELGTMRGARVIQLAQVAAAAVA